MAKQQHNWARNYTYSAARWHSPETVEQVQELVMRSKTVKALGSRHSFNHIADTTEDMISLENFPHLVEIDRERRTVTVDAGVRYGDFCQQLDREGFALHNLASLPHIGVAGACATATHGSGERNGNLSTAVAAIEFVAASGELITLSRQQHGEQFLGAVVGLGGLGVITKMTLDVVPSFTVRQDVYDHMPLSQLEAHFDEIEASAYSVSLFLDWNSDTINQVWLKSVVSEDKPFTREREWFGATLASSRRNPLRDVSAANCNVQMGIPGKWYERLPHFRMEFIPSNGEELQTEYFVPRQHALAAIRAVGSLREQISPKLLITEVRTIAADTLWMSPAYQQDCIGIHFTWKPDTPGVREVLPQIEAQLAPFGARPHWGKVFTMEPAQLQSQYTKLTDFQNLLQQFDPQGKFRNAFLNEYIYPR